MIVCFLVLSQSIWSQDHEGSVKQVDSTRFKYVYPDYIFQEPSWRLSLPIWVPGFRGSFAFGNITIDPDFEIEPPDSFNEENDRLRQSQLSVQFYLLLNLSYRYKRFFIEADGMKATLDNDITFTDRDRLNFGGTIDGTILRGMVGYRFYERAIEEKLFKWGLEAYAGIRFFDVHVFADRIELLDVRQDWIDPIIGIRAPIVFKRWLFALQGDYGGISGADHRSYFAALNASYRFSKLFGLGIGWAYLNAKYEGQLESKFLHLGMELTGPVMRLNLSF